MLVLIETGKNSQAVEHALAALLTLQAKPGSTYTLVDKVTKQPPEGLVLKREEDDLVVEVNEEVVARIDAFYGDDTSATFSADGSLTPAEDMAVYSADTSSAASTESKIVWSADSETNPAALSAWEWGGATLGAGAGAGAIATAGGGGAAAASSDLVITGIMVAGPVIAGHGLSVTAYKADGTVLGSGSVNADGSYTIRVDENYNGAVLVRVVDSDDGNDYFDEGSAAARDLTTDLRAVTNVSGSGTYTPMN